MGYSLLDPGKDLVLNYFPISSGLRNGAVVPLGQVIVEEDFHGGFEVLSYLAAGGVDPFQGADRDSQSGAGFGAFDELFGDFHPMEDYSLAGAGHVWKHAMFDRIVFGAIRRVVRHTQLQSQAIGQPLQVFLEQVLRRAIASAAITQNQQAFGMRIGLPAVFLPPHGDAVAAQFTRVVTGVQVDVGVCAGLVVDAVRNQFALARAAEIMVEGLDGLLRKGLAGAVKITEQFLLFRVDADHGIAGLPVFPSQSRDVLELGVAVGMMTHGFLLPRRASSHVQLPQQAAT